MPKILLSFLFFAVIYTVKAQTCSGPGRAANDAQAVCGSLTFVETDVSSCSGPNLPNFTCSPDLVSTDNSRWYKFHCYQSGTFGFLITPQSSGDDYDWAVMDITGHAPTDVYTTDLVISLNLSGITGITGCTPTGTLNTHCSGGVAGSQYNQLLNLIAGNDYLLMVTNWTNSQDHYTITFSGTAQLNNNTTPTITNIAMVNCDPSKIQISFSEDILRSTITSTGSEITISGGPNTITGVVSAGGNSVPSLIINLAAPLAPGPYTVNIANGTDGDTYANVCQVLMVPTSTPFNISVTAPPVVASPVNYCQGATATALTATGTNLLWYTAATGGTGSATAPVPSTASVGTTMYYVSQTVAGCEGTRAAIEVDVTTQVTPAFAAVAPICAGTTLPALPTTSTNGITGTWLPALDNTTTTTYTFTPVPGQCASTTTLTITVNPVITPVFTSVAPVCSGATLSPLPTISNNGITGTWAPALNNIATTTYTFTPAAGSCTTTATLTITVNSLTIPTFTAIAPICSGATLTFPTTSNNGIAGTWSPALNNTGTTTYTFTPAAGLCATTATLTVTVNPNIVPAFTAIAPICSGAILSPLPTISNNGITGTWSPALNNTTTTTYTFTPTAGLCATTATLIITVITNTPVFTAVTPVCAGTALAPLPTTSNNGITGTWAPALNNTAATTYTFTPTAGQCAISTTLTITVNPYPVVNIGIDTTICEGSSVKFLPSIVPAATSYTWRINPVNVSVPASTIDSIHIKDATVNPVDTVQYILRASLNACTAEDTVQVNVKWKPVADAGTDVTICGGDSTMLTAIVSHISGFADSLAWTPITGLRMPTAVHTNTILTWAAPTASTIYMVTAYTHLSGYGCEFEAHDSVRLVIPAPVIASAGHDTIAVSGVPHQLYGSGGERYKWWSLTPGVSVNNPLSQHPTVILTGDASIFVEVKNSAGCTDTASLLLKVYDGPAYYVPNAFSPNGDGLNDIFRAIPPGIAMTIYFRVFDRYGMLVFETNQYLKGWDGTYKGKPAPAGVYVWSVKGVDRNNRTIARQGTVLLVR